MRYQIEVSKVENRCVVWEIKRGVGEVVFKREGEGCILDCKAFKERMQSKALLKLKGGKLWK